MAQEQIMEEVNKFQESFEELVKRIELLEGQQKRATMDKRVDTLGSRVETLEMDQQENQNSLERLNDQIRQFETQMQAQITKSTPKEMQTV